MRIRQIRPEFFTDPIISRLPAEVRLTYIGLWCAADDAGYLDWDIEQLGVLLFPYQLHGTRLRILERAGSALLEAGRLRAYDDCHCRLIVHLVDHQRTGGNRVYSVRDKHRVHTSLDKSGLVQRNVTLGNGTVRARTDPDGSSRAGLKDILGDFEQIVGKHDA